MLKEFFKKSYHKIHESIYNFKLIKDKPSVWAMKNIYFTKAESNFTGLLKYDLTHIYTQYHFQLFNLQQINNLGIA